MASMVAAVADDADWGTRRWSGVLTLVLLLMIGEAMLPVSFAPVVVVMVVVAAVVAVMMMDN